MRAHIDQHIAATHQVDTAKGRILINIVIGKNHHLSKLRAYPVVTSLLL